MFVATFVYCITVLSTVHTSAEFSDTTLEAFVPHLSVFFALLLTLAAVGALIVYIHHIPESINIMNLTAKVGDKLHRAIVRMSDEQGQKGSEETDASVEAWREKSRTESAPTIVAKSAGFIQQFDLEGLRTMAHKNSVQIILHRAPGDFLVAGDIIMSVRTSESEGNSITERMRKCYTKGANRTDVQDILFLSDQLVEVLGRALSTGVNDPHSAMLCLNWLGAGLIEFAKQAPAPPANASDPVLYRRVTFEDMLNRSFDEMRQYVAADRTTTLHAMGILRAIACASSSPARANACVQQMQRLARSANELLAESAAREEIEAELSRALSAPAPP